LAGVAPIGRYITDQESEADAPPSEMPLEFAGRRGRDIDAGGSYGQCD